MRAAPKEALIILLLSTACMAGTWFFHPTLPPWNPMTIEEGEISLEAALQLPDTTWIDARGTDAFESDHIPNAIPLNEDRWEELFEAFIINWDGVSTLIVYCDSRTCAASKSVADRLREALGTDDIFVLKGGWQIWQENQS